MEEQLKLIEPQLYKSETNFPPLRERLLHSGELRAWFKYYHGPNQWQERYYMEEHVFLTDRILMVACLFANGKMTLRTFKLEEISRIERTYDFEDKNATELVLSEASITFKRTRDKKHPDILFFKRPLPAEQGDPEGFDKLIDLLD